MNGVKRWGAILGIFWRAWCVWFATHTLPLHAQDEGLENIRPIISEETKEPSTPSNEAPQAEPSERPGLIFLPSSKPLEARQPKNLKGILRSAPSLQAPSFREIQKDDQVTVLRSEGEWYEVDLTTEQGLEFRGWVQAAPPPPPQRELPPVETGAVAEQPRSLLESSRYFWIGSDRIEEKFNLSFLLGLQNLGLKASGTPVVGSSQPNDYSFNGLAFQWDTDLALLETGAWGPEFRWLLDLRYRLGFFQVKFGNSSDIPADVRGAGYNVRSQNLRALMRGDFRVAYWQSGFYRVGLGAGLMFFESAPDLKRTNLDNVIFTQVSWLGFLMQLDHQIQLFDRFRISNSVGLALFPSVSESPNVSLSGSLQNEGFPLLTQLKFEYRWSRLLSAQISGEYLLAKAKHSGESRRADNRYTQVKMSFTNWQTTAGLGLHF